MSVTLIYAVTITCTYLQRYYGYISRAIAISLVILMITFFALRVEDLGDCRISRLVFPQSPEIAMSCHGTMDTQTLF